MTRADCRAGFLLRYRNANWEYQRRQRNNVEWRCTTTFEHIIFTDAEIQKLVAAGKIKVLDPRAAEKGDPDKVSRIHGERDYSDLDWDEAQRKLIWVLEARKLKRPGKKLKSAEWQKAIDRVFDAHQPDWKELRGRRAGQAMSRKPCVKSMQRWDRDAGVPAKAENLLPEHRRKGNFEDRVDAGVRDVLADMIVSDWMCRLPISMDEFKERIAIRIAAHNKRVSEKYKKLLAPGVAAIQTSIDLFDPEEVLRKRHGDLAAHMEFGSGEAQEDPKAPLDRVELDSTPADLFVIDPINGFPLDRPHIVVAIDRCTRMVLGWFVTFEKPSVHALMQTLRNAILPKDYIEEMNENHGWNIKHRCETYGVMRTLAVDRARENLAGHVVKLAVRIGINRILIMKGKAPWLKGCVERVIRTMSEKLLHPTKGTSMHNALLLMGYNPAKDAVCTIDDLDHGLHKYFIDIYPRQPRRMLNNARAIDRWRDLTLETPVTGIGDVAKLDHFFGRTDTAAVRRSGISAHNMQYTSAELQRHFKTPQFRAAMKKAGGKVTYHLDPGDIGQIHVRLPHTTDTIIVPVAPKWKRYATGLSLFHHNAIRTYTKNKSRDANDVDQLLDCKEELLVIMRAQAFHKRGSIHAAQTLARFEGVARYARYGEETSTTAPGSEAGKRLSRRKPVAAVCNDDKPDFDHEVHDDAQEGDEVPTHFLEPSIDYNEGGEPDGAEKDGDPVGQDGEEEQDQEAMAEGDRRRSRFRRRRA